MGIVKLIMALNDQGLFIKVYPYIWFILFFHYMEPQAGWKSYMILWFLWVKKSRQQSSLRPSACTTHAGDQLTGATARCSDFSARACAAGPPADCLSSLSELDCIFFFTFKSPLLTIRSSILPTFSTYSFYCFLSQKCSFWGSSSHKFGYISFRLRIFSLRPFL